MLQRNYHIFCWKKKETARRFCNKLGFSSQGFPVLLFWLHLLWRNFASFSMLKLRQKVWQKLITVKRDSFSFTTCNRGLFETQMATMKMTHASLDCTQHKTTKKAVMKSGEMHSLKPNCSYVSESWTCLIKLETLFHIWKGIVCLSLVMSHDTFNRFKARSLIHQRHQPLLKRSKASCWKQYPNGKVSQGPRELFSKTLTRDHFPFRNTNSKHWTLQNNRAKIQLQNRGQNPKMSSQCFVWSVWSASTTLVNEQTTRRNGIAHMCVNVSCELGTVTRQTELQEIKEGVCSFPA